MKKYIYTFLSLFIILLISGCSKGNIKNLNENIKKIELTGNLVTYQAYFHNVIEYNKKAQHLFEKDRNLFVEYTGTIKFGINLTEVKIEVNNNKINVFIPKATVIGEPNIDEDDFKAENFIESKDGLLNKNPITVEDSSNALNQAQEDIKENAINNEELLSMAQKRAKVILEENIKQISGLNENDYEIIWEYGI